MLQVSGNTGNCPQPARGEVRQRGLSLFLYDGSRPDHPFLGIKLNEDGSVNKVIRNGSLENHRTRVTIPAGTGPRPIELLGYEKICGYRITPG